jgi:hypothetical protein
MDMLSSGSLQNIAMKRIQTGKVLAVDCHVNISSIRIDTLFKNFEILKMLQVHK